MPSFANRIIWGATTALALFALWAISPWATSTAIQAGASLGLLFFSLLVAGLALVIVRQPALSARLRRAWLFWLLACLAAVAAEAPVVLDALAGRSTPFPGVTDLIALLAYPLFF